MTPYRTDWSSGEPAAGQGARIAQAREAIRLFELAEDLAELGAWHIDPATLLVQTSERSAALLGFARADSLSIPMVLERIDARDRFGFLRCMMRAFQGSSSSGSCRIRYVAPGGSRTLLVKAQRDALAEGPRLFGIVQDISAHAAIEQSLREARDAADCATRAKSEFLASMSHEIRTPMTGILGMLDLLGGVADPVERGQYMAAMRQSAQTLMAVLDGVLDFSKIEAGRIELNCREFDLAALVRQTVIVFQAAASQKGVSLDLDFDPPGPAMVVGDPLRIQQVLSNFISNAAKFTQAGRIGVAVRAKPARAGRQRWSFSVSDTGVGMDPSDVERLFEPFVQVGERGRAGGTGLGLAISRRIIEAMGGTAKVRSKKDRGSTFAFALDLPVAAGGQAAANSADGDEETAAAGGARRGRALSILIAEDNAISQLLVSTLMRRHGHRVTCVDNGRRAVESALAMPFDCILMDMQMPEMDGVQATRAIRESGGRNALIPIIALTADAVPERRRFYENVGLTGFLTKPIDRQLLFAAVDSIALAPPLRSTRPVAAPAIDHAQVDDLLVTIGARKLRKLLEMTCAELASRPAALRALAGAEDIALLRKEAHGFKGAVASLGLAAVARAAKAVELALPGTELELALDRLDSEARRATAAIRSLDLDRTDKLAAHG